MTNKRFRFCDRKLLYYRLDENNNRNYDENDTHLSKLVQADLITGTRKEKDSEEVRYIKLMFQTKEREVTKKRKQKNGKYKNVVEKEVVPNPPKTLQQVLKKFPLRIEKIQGRIAIQEEDKYEVVVKQELNELHDKCIRLLTAYQKEEEVIELQERWEALVFQTYKTDVRGRKSKGEKIHDFLNDFDFGK